MPTFPFCPNPLCRNHVSPPRGTWFTPSGAYATLAFGLVRRFRCTKCGRTFSRQTFSIDYYAKKVVDYRDLLQRHASAECGRAIGRALGLSPGSVMNRMDRLARQALALHARLRKLAWPREELSIDGFVSFDVSQFFPSEICISVTAESRFVLDLAHASRRRSGSTTEAQRKRAEELYARARLEPGAIARGFREVVVSAIEERPPSRCSPLVINTDEKREYASVIRGLAAFGAQDEAHRIVHRTVSSKLPRTYRNPLFPSNYLEREIRKDQANHRRETTCFGRNVGNNLARLTCYLVHHDYLKRFLIKAPKDDTRTHAEAAGIPRGLVEEGLAAMFAERAWLSKAKLPGTLWRIWAKECPTPLKDGRDYLPAYALA
jgi:hypothetical protein